jgi:uncharacterized protein YjeT (DUF2065 family)
MAWSDLFAALALLFVLEGILPFVSPHAMKRLMLRVSASSDRELRAGGLAAIIAGLALLSWVRF